MQLRDYYRFGLLLIFVFLFGCGDSLTYEQKIEKYNFYVNKSDSLLRANEFEEAISYANTAIKMTDTLSIAYIKKGIACYELDWLEASEECFDEAIDIEGDKSTVYKLRSLVHLKNDDSDFLDDINNYLEHYGDDEEALELRRNYYESENEISKAIEEYSKIISKYPDSVDLILKRSKLLIESGDNEQALIDYESILKLNPNNEFIIKDKARLENLLFEKHNKNKFLIILLITYLLYVAFSFFLLKPLVLKKAEKQIGGEFEISKDPLIWILPIILAITFFTLYFTNSIPNF
ncbi:tetratricopeptide repeat protein [Corallibacter sp.]|uniref:tetratricopeptide repeat protein n=1 Tax=Corallibacter sp. TaxID=2038084 RepID=UPI003A9347E7